MNCIICKKNSWKVLYKKLKKCRSCGFVRANDKYFNLNTSKLYSNKYFNEYEYTDYKKEEAALSKNFINRINKIRKYKTHGNLLEIGCAYGYFLKKSKIYFKVEGIDIDKEVTAIAHKESSVNIHTGDFLRFNPKKKYDIICMFDVIEHLKKPEAYVKKCYELLNDDGIIVIETGDISGLLPKIQNRKWRLITPPFHLQYFSAKNLSRLLTNNKFKTIYQTNNIPFYRTLRQVAFRLGIKTPKFVNDFTFPTYTFDLTFIIAKK